MNYYDHHIGDYDSATAHLSWAEDAAYRRLICLYYRTERPIPLDIKAACRLVRAQDKDQRAAVETVLQEFFIARDDGWHQQRCDDEIGEYKAAAPEREARKTNEALRLARHREERAALFGRLNEAGQHAAWNASIAQLREMVKRLDSENGNAPATPETPKPATPATAPETPTATGTATPATATQYPPPNTHLPIPNKKQKSVCSAAALLPELPEALLADWLKVRKEKKQANTATAFDGVRREAGKAGLTLEDCIRICCENGWASFKASWDWNGKVNGNHGPPRESPKQREARELFENLGRSRNDGNAGSNSGSGTTVDGTARRVD